MSRLIPFEVGEKYSREDIYQIMNVPIERRKGIWNTGYAKYNGDWFIFAGINTTGRTGHDYENKFIGRDLEWYGKDRSNINQPSIKSLINPEGNIYIFTRDDNKNPKFIYRGNARCKNYEDTIPVKIIWEIEDPNEVYLDKLPEELSKNEGFYEGASKKVYVNIYERDSGARSKCIEHYGPICQVCGFDFYSKYGDLGKGFIHVHHVVQLSEIGQEYRVDPINDLKPVCPNCHAMLHKRKPSYSIEELKEIIENHINL